MYLERKTERRGIEAFSKILATYPNGGGLDVSELAADEVYAGAVVGKGSDGLFHVLKTAALRVAANNTQTTYVVGKGHGFKVGDFVATSKGGASYAITAIVTNQTDISADDITLGTTLGVNLTAGSVLFQSASSGTNKGELKVAPIGMLAEDYTLRPGADVEVAVVIEGVARKEAVPPINDLIAGQLKGIHIL